MSALTEKITAEHEATVGFNEGLRCRCDGHAQVFSVPGYTRHVAEVTEAAARQQIGHEIKTAVLPTHPNRSYRDGFVYAARIARGES